MTKIKKHPTCFEYSAGGIVFRRTSHGPEIAFIEDPWHRWTFAKGHLEKGESVKKAALRETSEEMGVPQKFLKVIAPLGKINFWFKEQRQGKRSPKGALVQKFVYYFLMQAPANICFRPQAKEQIHFIRWVPLGQALRFSSYSDAKPALKKAIDYFKEKGSL